MRKENAIKLFEGVGLTKKEAEEQLQKGGIVYAYSDYIKFFDEYTYGLDDDEKKEVRDALTEAVKVARKSKTNTWVDIVEDLRLVRIYDFFKKIELLFVLEFVR